MLAVVALGSTVSARPFEENGARQSAANQPYWVEQLASGLKYPSAMLWLPNGDILITERQGGLRLVRDSVLMPNVLMGVPPVFHDHVNGLKDIVLDPHFDENGSLYLLISEGSREQHYAAVYSAEYHLDGLINVKRIFRSSSDGGNPAGRLLLLADGTLLIATHDARSAGAGTSQKLDSHLGKTLRINRDGSIPRDNPFGHTANSLPEIWTYGHRGATGLFLDSTDNRVWAVEPGPRGGDELNVLKPGADYGWPSVTWGFDYSGLPISDSQFAQGSEAPVLVWTPQVTPSGIMRYWGSAYPLWNGDFFVGDLSGRALERLRVVNYKVVLQEKLLLDLEERIRDVKTGPDTRIYLLTDHPNGRLLRLQPGQPQEHELARVAQKLQTRPYDPSGQSLLPRRGDALRGKQAFLDHCASCHKVGSIVSGEAIGPDLTGIYGRKAGSQSGYSYSVAMKKFAGVWDYASLNFLINDPESYVPGTSMTALPVIDPDTRRQIVAFLIQSSKH